MLTGYVTWDLPAERPALGRCRWCGEEIRAGEAYYDLGARMVCPCCLPRAAAALLLPFRAVAGEEAGR